MTSREIADELLAVQAEVESAQDPAREVTLVPGTPEVQLAAIQGSLAALTRMEWTVELGGWIRYLELLEGAAQAGVIREQSWKTFLEDLDDLIAYYEQRAFNELEAEASTPSL